MRPALLFGLTVAAASIATAAEPVHHIGIVANVPTVKVSPRRAGRVNMRLPTLTYALNVIVDCDEEWQPDSVSISIADSSAVFGPEQLETGPKLDLELKVPSSQIAPLRVEQFCIAEGAGAQQQNKIRIAGVVSAQASLRCATESTESIVYISEPLDVELECATPETN